ncbi:hypothetical protein PACTADRAFT_51446 [Pachysolen tannophilus NRRL Y-2460]|uniref:Peptidase M16 N-terminal domain-containing protein n=1 Tax=Pachysolen tannophilus NRRL Y-2460 TaxID=669874 RepID=A0A1E4TPN6_PACTA|nr:hypothetical protein PACTADRAFT_51446 [Pachysolen tannophilus NRRL Y-2460]
MSSYRTITENLQKPDLDDRSYRLIELENNLKALVIHDPTTDKSAASLDCNVGSFNDPKNLPGLAHFCEHLLFMGTKKYPNENDYSSYLSQHSGYSNAYTSKLDTNYYFELNYNYLEGALDRFAQFFINPLFSKSCKDREIKAVDSENKKNLQNDVWRLSQLDKSLSSPLHPYNKFSTGNLNTLSELPLKEGVDVRDELINFYNKHYSSNLMRLVVLGREDLDTLTKWVVEKFSEIPNKDKSKSIFNNPPFTKKELQKLIKAKPVMDTKSMELTFITPDQSSNWESQPQRYFSHLIGHEGKGSLLYYFKEKGWANELSSGSMNISKNYSVFAIEIDLTDKGLENYQEIILNIFQYLKMLEKNKPQEWIFKELKDISNMNFKFKQKSSVSNTVSKLSNLLNKVDDSLPYEFFLSQSILRKYDPKLIEEYGSYLNPENFKVLLVSPTFNDLPLREKWYGTEHSVEDIDSNFIEKLNNCSICNENLHLPLPNEFVPTNFDVNRTPNIGKPANRPKLIKSTDKQRIWFKKDDQFFVPKANLGIMFHCPVTQSTPFNSTLTNIFLDLIEDALNDIAYDASIVGLHYGLSATRDGFSLKVSGYNDKLTVLLEKVLDHLVDFKPTSHRFEVLKEKCIKAYKNFGYSAPYGQIGHYSTTLLYDNAWLIDEKLKIMQNLKYDDLVTFIPSVMKQLFIETFVHGNFNETDALKISDILQNKFGNIRSLSDSQYLTARSLLIKDQYRYIKELSDPKDINSCIEYFIQFDEIKDMQKLALADLVAQVTHEPCFNELRTKEQLGYVVFSGVKKTRTTFGYRILIQSERTTDYLEFRIVEFLQKFRAMLSEMSSEKFNKNVESLIAKKLLKKKNLSEEFSKIWGCITSGFYDFDFNEQEVEVLKKLSKNDLLNFYDDYILNFNNQKKLITHLKSQSALKQSEKKLINISILNHLSKINKYESISSNKLEELINSYDAFKNYDIQEITDFIKSLEFKELLKDDDKLLKDSDFQNKLISQIVKDLNNPTPDIYPSGKLINSISAFKAENPLTAAVQPVEDLNVFLDHEIVNGVSKL